MKIHQAYIFLLHKQDRPSDLPPLEFELEGEFWHCGIIYKDKVYETFGSGRYSITDLKDRETDLEKAEVISMELKHPENLNLFVIRGQPSDNFVNSVLGLPLNKNKNKVVVNFMD
ncbi:MAG: hypothetical protein V1824_01940 [archaeon]